MRLTLLSLLVVATAAAQPTLTPGQLNRGIECDGGRTFDAYVPKGYDPKGTVRHPALFVSDPGGNPNPLGLERWADKRGVIIITINDSENGLQMTTINAIQDAVIAGAEKHLRLHPCLRFATGMSGGAWCSENLVVRKPDSFAGVLMHAHSGGRGRIAKHQCIAYVHGTKDDIHPLRPVVAKAKLHRSAGIPTKLVVIVGHGHSWAPTETAKRMLDWMLTCAPFLHVKMGKKARAAAKKDAVAQISALDAEKSPAETLVEGARLSHIPGVARWREAKKTLFPQWFKARIYSAGQNEEDSHKLFAYERVATDPDYKKAAAADRKVLTSQVGPLRKKPELADEAKASKLCAKALGMLARAERSTQGAAALRTQALAMLKQVAERYPATIPAVKANQRRDVENAIEACGGW